MSDVMERQPRVAVKREEYAVLYNDGTILVKEVRLSYPHLFARYRSKEDKEKGRDGRFSLTGLMPKTRDRRASKDLIKGEILRVLQENKLKALPADKLFLRDGDLAAKDEYEGMFTVSAAETRNRPSVLDNRRDPKTRKLVKLLPGVDEDRIQPGYWGNMLIRPWFQDNDNGKRVNANLISVQFVREDEVFGQGRITEDDIDQTFGEFTADDDSGYDDSLGIDDNEL